MQDPGRIGDPGGHTPTRYERWVKPVLDRVFGAFLLVALLPVMGVLALVVRLSLGRGVIYRQARVGLHGRPFVMFKFRTMEPDRRRDHIEFHGRDRRSTHKSAHDPRHTRLGQFLRRYSLDELPQLWNVVRGDLSLVGPRPELVEIVDRKYQPWQHARHVVKPGLTGLWQVTQRDEEGKMHLHVDTDLRYIENLSLRTDLAILVMTPPLLFHAKAPDWFGLLGLASSSSDRVIDLPAGEPRPDASEEMGDEARLA